MSLLPADFIAYTYGANLVSTCLSCVSWEILVALGWQYFSRFPEDRWVYKGLAAFMLVAGTADTAINCQYTCDLMVTHFGSELYILYTAWNFESTVVLIGLTCVVLQVFMSYRIWIVSERRWRVYPACSVLLSVGGAVISFWLASWYQKQELTLALAATKINILIWFWFGADTLSELISTLALNYFLVLKPRRAARHLSPSHSSSHHSSLPERSLLHSLARRAIETNLLSLATHILIVVLYAKYSTLLYWYSVPAFLIVKVYGISLLVTLNARGEGGAASFGGGSGRGVGSDFGRFSVSRGGGQVRSEGAAFDLEAPAQEDGSADEQVGFSFGATRAVAFPPPAASEVSAASGAGGRGLEKAGAASFDGDEGKAEVRVGWV